MASVLSTCQQENNVNLNPMSFTDQHSNNVLERLRYQRDTGRFCDVYIVVKDRHFCAHRNVLAACSPYFDSILKHSKVVKEQVVVNCQNPAVFELLLNYMYSGSVVIDRSIVTDLLKLANNFLVTRVKNYCAEYLDRYMDYANCLSVKELAVKYNLPALFKSACDFFDGNLHRCLLESSDVVEFPISQLNALLSEPKYSNTISPDVHLKLIVRWVGHNPEQRNSHFAKLLVNCPFALVQPSTLEYLLDYSLFLINSQVARYTFLELMSKNSISMAKYHGQYSKLCSQFGNERNNLFTDVYSNDSQTIDGPNDISQSAETLYENERKKPCSTIVVNTTDSEMLSRISDDETGQPPVVGASTTDQVLNSSETSGPRPALKLKIHLNSLNILNRKSRLLAAAGRHKFYRKSVTAANQVLAKRRGRPPKNHSFSGNDMRKNFESDTNPYPDVGIDISDQLFFDEEDEVDPYSEMSESDSEENETEKAFKCIYCQYRASTSPRIKSHVAREHTKGIIYMCSLCVFECRWNRDYYAHMKTHFNGPPYRCDFCEFIEEKINVFLSHRLTHSNEEPFKCSVCEFKSRTRSCLISHQKNHNEDKPFHCSECDRSFTLQSTLDQHLILHSSSHLISHQRIHTGDGFHCHYEECSYSSPKKSQLAAHLRTHLGVRAYRCKVCNRSFIEKSHLVRHERIHLADKPFKCDNCDYSSSRRDKLKEHIQKHHSNTTGIKQHRRRYRRAKQLAQLAAQTQNKPQPNPDAVFMPIKVKLENPENVPESLSVAGLLPNDSEFMHPEINHPTNDNNSRESNSREQCPQQSNHVSLLDFVPLSGVHATQLGRPLSAIMPSTTSMAVSPAMSLNFHIGAIIDSPVESLRTPVPRSPHNASMHSVTDYYDNSSTTGGQDAQRPMSLPPYGGPSAINSQLGPPWAW